MVKRIKPIRSDRKAKSESKSMTPTPARRFQVFGRPQVLEGEDAAALDDLLARICDTIKPADIIEEMFIADVVSLEWEILRWRRLKWTLVQATGLKALERFLIKQLEANYALHEEQFERYLADIFRNNPPEDQADAAQSKFAAASPKSAVLSAAPSPDAVPTMP